jgi:hypothetical protein
MLFCLSGRIKNRSHVYFSFINLLISTKIAELRFTVDEADKADYSTADIRRIPFICCESRKIGARKLAPRKLHFTKKS